MRPPPPPSCCLPKSIWRCISSKHHMPVAFFPPSRPKKSPFDHASSLDCLVSTLSYFPSGTPKRLYAGQSLTRCAYRGDPPPFPPTWGNREVPFCFVSFFFFLTNFVTQIVSGRPTDAAALFRGRLFCVFFFSSSLFPKLEALHSLAPPFFCFDLPPFTPPPTDFNSSAAFWPFFVRRKTVSGLPSVCKVGRYNFTFSAAPPHPLFPFFFASPSFCPSLPLFSGLRTRP